MATRSCRSLEGTTREAGGTSCSLRRPHHHAVSVKPITPGAWRSCAACLRAAPRHHGEGASRRPRQDPPRPADRNSCRDELLPSCGIVRSSAIVVLVAVADMARRRPGRDRDEPLLAGRNTPARTRPGRSRPAHAANSGLAGPWPDHHHRHRHSCDPSMPHRRGLRGAGEIRCRPRPHARRRILACRSEAHPGDSQTVFKRPMVERECPERHPGEPRRRQHRFCRNPRRR